MNTGIHIPIKYKFLSVILLIMFTSLGLFFYFAVTTFSEDKKLFVMDLNMSLLKAANSEVKLALKGRLEELQVFVPRIYNPLPSQTGKEEDPYQGLPDRMKDELLGVTFYKKGPKGFEIAKQYRNADLIAKRNLNSEDIFRVIAGKHALPFDAFTSTQNTEILNRSVRVPGPRGNADLALLTFMVGGTFLNDESKEVIIVVDIIQDFLRKLLQQSEIAEVFLIFKDGRLLTHPTLTSTVEYSTTAYAHPVVPRLASKQLPRESMELEIDGEAFLLNISETGFRDIMVVSQIRKSEAFLALRTLLEKSVLIALVILTLAILFSVLFAARLTTNIRKLKEAAEHIGTGHLKVKLDINSNDELQHVAESFTWMTGRLKELISESAQKARLEDELETARLVQSTLLTAPEIPTDAIEIVSHYVPATECGGDLWDASLVGSKLTVFIGDATGHGAPAAIVTAVAKSSFSTLNTIYGSQALTPEQLLTVLNQIICSSCKGKLLMTMCIIQLDLETGELRLCNAGHESPLCLRAPSSSSGAPSDNKKAKAEVLFARGERLGFNPNAEYEGVTLQIGVGDTVLLYTDGISEAKDSSGKDWGERALKKAFAGSGTRPLTQIRDEMMAAMNVHTAEAQQADDITFVLFSWKRLLSMVPQSPAPLPPSDSGGGGVTESTAGQEAITMTASLDGTSPEAAPVEANDTPGGGDESSGDQAA